MTTAVGERPAQGRFEVPRGLMGAGVALGLLWLLVTAISIASEPRASLAADPLDVGWEPLLAIGVAVAALHRSIVVGVFGALAVIAVAIGAELLRAWVLVSSTQGAGVMYAYDTGALVLGALVYLALIVVATVAAPRPRSVSRDLLLTLVLLPFAALALLGLSTENGLLGAVFAAASGLWLVAILGVSRPVER